MAYGDLADLEIEQTLNKHLAIAQEEAALAVTKTVLCCNCQEELTKGSLSCFCDTSCREDYEHRKTLEAIAGKGHARY